MHRISPSLAEIMAKRHGLSVTTEGDRLRFWRGVCAVGSTLIDADNGVQWVSRHAVERIIGERP